MMPSGACVTWTPEAIRVASVPMREATVKVPGDTWGAGQGLPSSMILKVALTASITLG